MTRAPDFQGSRSERQIARILAALADGPKTMQQIADRLHLTRAAVHIYIKHLRNEPRRVRIAGYQRNGVKPFNLYALGSEPDMPFVRTRTLSRRKVRTKTSQEVAREQLLTALADEPQTCIELSMRLKVSIAYVREHMRTLREQREVYVSKWEYPIRRGGLSAVYSVGKNRKDKSRPVCGRREYAKRVQADPVKCEARLARRRVQERLRSAPETPFSALFVGSPA